MVDGTFRHLAAEMGHLRVPPWHWPRPTRWPGGIYISINRTWERAPRHRRNVLTHLICRAIRTYFQTKIALFHKLTSKLNSNCIVVFFYNEIVKTRSHLIRFRWYFSKTSLFVLEYFFLVLKPFVLLSDQFLFIDEIHMEYFGLF